MPRTIHTQHIRSRTEKSTHTHAYCTQMTIRARTHARECTHTFKSIHKHGNTHTKHTRTHAHTLIQHKAHSPPHTHTTHTHTHTHTYKQHSHMHIYTNKHSHTHTHTQYRSHYPPKGSQVYYSSDPRIRRQKSHHCGQTCQLGCSCPTYCVVCV